MQTEFTCQRAIPEAIRTKHFRSYLPSYGRASDGGFARPMVGTFIGPVGVLFSHPLFILGALWPLVLLAPHLPGIPRPSMGGLPWRQELGLSLLLTVALGLLFKQRQSHKEIRIDRQTLLVILMLGLFVFWTWLSAVWATNPYPAIHLGLQWSTYLVFFVLMTAVATNPRMIHSSFVALAGVIWVLAIACAIETWFGAPLTDGNLRSDLKPLLRGSGGFGEIMAMAAILFAALALHVKRRSRALACGATAIMGWMATLQSLERAPFIGASLGFCLLITGAVIKKSRTRRTLWRLCLLVGALGLVLLFQTMPLSTPQASSSTSTLARLGHDPSADANTRVRFLFWGIGLEMLRTHPLLGVGGNNYEVAYAAGRAQFAARHPDSTLVSLNEDLLTVYAHNEYIQLLAELGLIGFLLFVLLSLGFAANFWRALKHRSLPALGAGGAMLAFAISSGASGSSFRYLGGGLLFFFAAALITRGATSAPTSVPDSPKTAWRMSGPLSQVTCLCACALTLLIVGVLSTQAAGTVLHGLAQGSAEPTKAEGYYRASLRVYPASAATHFGYGLWLYSQRRATEGVPHLRSAVEGGFNTSICYAYLAGAEESAGDLVATERTLATAVRVYPVSVFLLVRHASALARNGREADSKMVFSRALLLDPRAARGWQQLIDNDIDAAYVAAQQDGNISLPGELTPRAAVFEVLQENEQRFPAAVNTGWRARMRSQQSQ